MTAVRVGFFGNTGNNFFQLATALRRHSDLDVRLFLNRKRDRIQNPESDDPSLASSYPEWIHEGDYSFSLRSLTMPWTSSIVDDLKSCDFVVVSDVGPVYAPFTGRPWGFLVTGGDLTVVPFPIRFRERHTGVVRTAGALGLAAWQRHGIRRATRVWAQRFVPNDLALGRLGLAEQRIATEYLPFPLDTERFRPDPSARTSPDPIVRDLVDSADFVVFHPSRLMMRNTRPLRESGQWKRNEVLLQGFADFVRAGLAERPVLAMPARSESPDIEIARRMIDDLGIADHVRWLKPPRPDGFTRHELIALYSVADAVVDEFGMGWFGMVVLEGLALEKPVISHIDETVMSRMYPWHPVLSTDTPEGVAAFLCQLAADPVARAEIGRRGREWILEFHSHAAVAPRYVDAFTAAAALATVR